MSYQPQLLSVSGHNRRRAGGFPGAVRLTSNERRSLRHRLDRAQPITNRFELSRLRLRLTDIELQMQSGAAVNGELDRLRRLKLDCQKAIAGLALLE